MALPPWLFAALILVVVCGFASYKAGIYENFYPSSTFEWPKDVLQDISGMIFPTTNSRGRIIDRGITSNYDNDAYSKLVASQLGTATENISRKPRSNVNPAYAESLKSINIAEAAEPLPPETDLMGAGGSAAAATAAPAFYAPPGSYLLTVQPADSMLYAPQQQHLDTIQSGSDIGPVAAAHTPSITKVLPDAAHQPYLPTLTASTDIGNTPVPSLRQMIRDDIDNTVKNEVGAMKNEYAIQYAYQ